MLETERPMFNMRIDPVTKKMLLAIAKHERRSMSATIEVTVRERFSALGLTLDGHPDQSTHPTPAQEPQQ